MWPSLSFARLFFLLWLANSISSQAAVTITQATATSISADGAANSTTTPAYSTIGNIVIEEGANTDFSAGASVTLVLGAPAGWTFNAGVGSVSFSNARDISSASLSVTSASVTVTFTVGGTAKSDRLTISGLQVRADEGANIPGTGTITRTGGTATINGAASGAVLGTLGLVAGAISNLIVTLPDETFTDASTEAASGNSGTASAQAAGISFTITKITATDQFLNIVTTYSGAKTLSYSGPGGTPSYTTAVSFTSGQSTTALTTTLRKAETTAITVSNGTVTGQPSSTLTITAGDFTKMQLLVPGETASPGSTTGKTGTPTARTAGTPFDVTVNAVDANWNVVNSTDTVRITSNDTTAPLPVDAALSAGSAVLSVTFRKVGTATLTASNLTDPAKTANTSPSITINAGAFSKLQILMPGETTAPGTDLGKTGTPTARTAGTAFNVTVNSVDANWNLVSSTDTVAITSSDPNATLPANAALSAGTRSFSVTLKTAGSSTVTASDVTSPAKSPDTSTAATVNAAAFTKMQLLVPGETAAPGSTTGKTGTPTAQTAGTAFDVTVRAVDAYWNLTTSTHTIAISSTDTNGIMPANAALVAGSQTFSVTLKTAGTATLTATNVSDGTKTANTSPAITVTAGPFVKLQLLLPGETAAPGSTAGKTGSPTARTAGTAFNVTARAVDAYWNIASSTDTVSLAASDPYATLPAATALTAGSATLSVTFKTATPTSLTLSDVTDNTKTASSSPTVTVNAGAFNKLQILVPGETSVPGSTSGKTGTPDVQTAAVAFSVTVKSVDANWNAVSSTDTIAITSSDTNAILPANAALVAGTRSLSITLKTAGTPTVTASDVTTPARTAHTSPPITVNPGPFVKLQLLVPGETAAPGSATGKTGSPSSLAAGIAYNLTVNAVDANWNVVSSTDTIALSCTDTNATVPSSAPLTAGVGTFPLTFKTAGTRTVTATDQSDGTKTANTSPSITVTAGAFAKLQILLPGESAVAGTPTGKTGSPIAQTAGTAFNVTVNSVDSSWNKVSSTDTVAISSSDSAATLPANASLAAGTKTFSITLKKAGSSTVTATDISDGSKSPNTSPAITVNPGPFAKLLVLLPGESANPGSATGRTGPADTQTAGTSFSLQVKAVDANWNTVSATDTVRITCSEATTILPANAALVSGSQSFAITAKRASSMTFTATDLTDGTKTANTSSSATIVAGPLTKLQLLVPGETTAIATDAGKTGTPTAQSEAIPFNVIANAVDAYWNVVTTCTHTVGFSSTDTAATLPANTALVAGTANLSFTFGTRGTNTITLSNITDPSIPASVSPGIVVGRTYAPATGGEAISADGANGAFTTLNGPIYSESLNGDVGVGTIILNAPAGFVFDTGGISPTVLMTRLTGTGGDTRNINGYASGTAMAVTSVSATQITLTITSASNLGVTCRLTWQDVRVRPTSGTPLIQGSIVKSGTAALPGIDADTDLGTLVMTAGAASQLTVQSQPATTAVAGVVFNPQPSLLVKDQFGNPRSLANGNADNSTVVTATRSAGAGTVQGTLTATASDGLVTFSDLNHHIANTITIAFSSPGLTGTTSQSIVITPTTASNLSFLVQPGAAAVGAPFGTQPVVITKDQYGNVSNVGLPTVVSITATLTSGTGVLLGTTVLDIGSGSGNGTISYSNLRLDRVGTDKQLTAATGGFGSAVSDIFTVVKGSQTITFPAISAKTYGDAPFPVAATASSGLPITFQVVSGPATISGSTVTITGAGTIIIRASQAGDDDYNAAPNVDLPITVNKALLTATADNFSKVYGADLPVFTASYSGFFNGDTFAVISGSPGFSTTALSSSPTGTYPITIQLGTLSADNYTFGFVNGTLTINPAPLTITAVDTSKVYGAALPAFTASYSGLVNSDTPSSLTTPVSFTTSATSASPVGTYPIVPSNAASSNYTITFVDGVLTVTKSLLTVRADNKRAVVDCYFPTFTASYSGFVNSDPATVLTGSPDLTSTGNANSPAGSYPIVAALGTLAADNYNFTFVDGTLTVTLVSLPPTMTSFTDQQIFEDNSVTIAFTVSDPDNDLSELTMSGQSTNPSLVASSGFTFSGTEANRSVTILPIQDAFGSATIEIIARDLCLGAVTNRFLLTVSPVNDAPSFTLSTTSLTVNEDANLSTFLEVITDIKTGPTNEPDDFDRFLVTPQTHTGFSVAPIVSSGGSVFFKPAPNAFGTNTFSVQLKDAGGTANGGSDTSVAVELTIIVLPINDPPVITGLSSASMLEDRTTAFPFVLSDLESAPEDLILAFRSLNQSVITDSGLSVTGVGTNRTLNIIPVPDAVGTAVVELIAVDHQSGSVTNLVSVTVQPVNDVPSFDLPTQLITVAEDSPNQIMTGFANNLVTGPPNESTQLLTFLVTNTNAAFFAVPPAISATGTLQFRTATNVFGTNTITVRLKDNGGTSNSGVDTSSSQQFTIAVTPVNDPPVVSGLLPRIINEDTSEILSFNVADVDTSLPDVTVTASSSNQTLVSNASLALVGQGATRSITVSPSANINGTTTITLVADDGFAQHTTSFLLTVRPVNDSPSFVLLNNVVTVQEDSSLANISLISSFSTGPADESGQSISYLLTVTNTAFFASAPVLSASGQLQFRPSTNVVGTNVIKVRIKDSGGIANGGIDLSATQDVSIVVLPINDPPVLAGLIAKNIGEDRPITFPFTVRDIDSPIENLVLTASSSNLGLIPNSGIVITGSTSSTNRSITLTPASNMNGTSSITVMAADGAGGTTTSRFQFTVLPVNDPPQFSLSSSAVSVFEDAVLFKLPNFATGISSGPSDEAAQTVTFLVTTTTPTYFSIPPTISPAGLLQFKTAANVNGTANLQVKLRDNGGVSAGGVNTSPAQQFSIAINPVNDAPVLGGLVARSIREETVGVFPFTVRDLDSIVSEISVTATSSNQFLVPNSQVVVSGESTNRVITVTPLENMFGSSLITVVATDPQAGSVTKSFTLTVLPVNDAPSFELSAPEITATEDTPLISLTNFVINISSGPTNEATQKLSFVVTTTNSSFFAVRPTISPNGILRFRPAANVNGTNTVRIQLKDSGGIANGGIDSAAPQLLSIIVEPVNDPPLITLPGLRTMLEDSTGTFNLRVTDIDSPIDSIQVSATTSNELLVPQADATLASGASATNILLTLNPAPNANGTVAITLVASDQSDSSTNVLVVLVLPVNDAPAFELAAQTVTTSLYATQQRWTNFAFNINPGPTNESQKVAFVVTTPHKHFFSAQPTITPAGVLSFTTLNNSGTAQVDVRLRDNGNTLYRGTNLSPTQTFSIVIPSNPFQDLKGNYNGLFHESDQVSHLSAGAFALSLDQNGKFTGKIILGSTFALSGQFPIETGQTQLTINRPGLTPLVANLSLDITGSASTEITGSIADGQWLASLAGDRAIFNSTNPTPAAGKYTLLIPGNNNPSVAPAGDSIASVTVEPNGSIRLSGILADGTPISQTSVVSGVNWPLYVPLYTRNGALISWIHFIEGSAEGFEGGVSWIKTASLTRYYPQGFTNEVPIIASAYVPPTSGSPLLQFTTGSIILSGGNLTRPLTNRVTLQANNTFTIAAAPNALTLSVSLASGQLTGNFIHPVTRQSTPIRGVVLQDENSARGFFLGSSQSGLFVLQPDP